MPVGAGSVHPSYLTWLGIAREAQTATAVMPVGALALEANSYDIEDTPVFLPDTAIRGSFTFLYNEVIGPTSSAFSFGGPAYLDIEGYIFDNMFGDLSSTGVASGSTTALAQIGFAGAVSGTVVSAAGFSGTAPFNQVQIGTGNTAEVVTVTGTTATILTFANTPLRFTHAAGMGAGTVVGVVGPYTHRFSTWNTGSGQPPTHTLTDFTGVTPLTGARQYVAACTAQLDLSGNAEQLLMWKVTGNAWTSAASSGTPTVFTNFVIPIANWRGTVFVGGQAAGGTIANGTAFANIGEWSVSFKRKLQIYWTAQGTNNPYFIGRGPLDATGTINYALAVGTDETPLTNMLTPGLEPPVVVAINNGLSGTSLLSLQLQLSQVQFTKAKPVRTGELFTYQDEYQAVGNANDVGGSGGLGPGVVTVVNNVPTY